VQGLGFANRGRISSLVILGVSVSAPAAPVSLKDSLSRFWPRDKAGAPSDEEEEEEEEEQQQEQDPTASLSAHAFPLLLEANNKVDELMGIVRR
jgi:hypothetical protein